MEGPRKFESAEELGRRVGTELGVSDWVTIDQAMIDAFAALTGDQAMIHVDPPRAAAAGLGGTVAHGFLTLSLLSAMAYQVCPAITGARYGVNYGFNRLRFVAPVPSGSRVRGRFRLAQCEARAGGGWQAGYEVTVEIEGRDKPALVAEWLTVVVA